MTGLFTHPIANLPAKDLAFFFLSLKFMLRVQVESYVHTNHKEETQKGALKDNSSFRKP